MEEPKLTGQQDIVLKILKQERSIPLLDLVFKYNIPSASTRISELIRLGFPIHKSRRPPTKIKSVFEKSVSETQVKDTVAYVT